MLHKVVDHGLEGFFPETVVISPDESCAVYGCKDQVCFCDLATGEFRSGFSVPEAGNIRQVVFSNDGRQMALGGSAPFLGLADPNTGAIRHVLHGHDGRCNAIGFSPDGLSLVSAGDDMVARTWNTVTGSLKKELRGHTEQVFAAIYHPDGTRIATAGRDGSIRIWDAETGEELLRLQGHSGYVFSLAFSPDGSTLLSGSGDSTLRLWDTLPLTRRMTARREAQDLQPAADLLVTKLLTDLRDPKTVIKTIRSDTSLNGAMQQSAWHALLRRVMQSN